jgi:hypothetical protein
MRARIKPIMEHYFGIAFSEDAFSKAFEFMDVLNEIDSGEDVAARLIQYITRPENTILAGFASSQIHVMFLLTWQRYKQGHLRGIDLQQN